MVRSSVLPKLAMDSKSVLVVCMLQYTKWLRGWYMMLVILQAAGFPSGFLNNFPAWELFISPPQFTSLQYIHVYTQILLSKLYSFYFLDGKGPVSENEV